MPPVLDVERLTIATVAGGSPLVSDVSLSIAAAEIVGIVGESGSGKTMIAKSVLGLLPPGVRQVSGTIRLDDADVGSLSAAAMRSVRGAGAGMIFQEPMTSLNPSMIIGRQMDEGLRLKRRLPRDGRRKLIIDMLSRVGIRDPQQALVSYPHEFSGGMRQRIMIASAMLLKPSLLIADEPTTALDAIIQRDVLELMTELARENGTAIMLVSHDIASIARYTQRTIVMARGEILEAGGTAELMADPSHPITRRLLMAVPKRRPARNVPARVPIISVEKLGVDYRISSRFALKTVSKRVVRDVDLHVMPGEVVAVVGESGSGKTTIGKTLAGLVQPSSGRMLFGGRVVEEGGRGDLDYRRNCQMIFQDPYSSLDPRMTIGKIVAEPLRHVDGLTGGARRDRALAALQEVGLSPDLATRFPHQLSGGQRQRVAIARAVIARPQFIVADEPLSALDVTVRAQVLEVFDRLQQRYAFSCLFISHDLRVVEGFADRVVVMQAGEIVEVGSRDDVFDRPRHEYTKRLLAAR